MGEGCRGYSISRKAKSKPSRLFSGSAAAAGARPGGERAIRRAEVGEGREGAPVETKGAFVASSERARQSGGKPAGGDVAGGFARERRHRLERPPRRHA